MITAVAYFVGAFANHALFVLIHECAHNLLFKKRMPNFLAGMLCDFANVVPSAISFRRYHMKHHSFQGIHELDADLPSRWEANLIGRSVVGKALWLLFFPLVEGLRPVRLKEINFHSPWTWFNIILILSLDAAIFFMWGPWALLYLLLSLSFGIGLHPVGARWVQEHYLVAAPQETYSYYGPLNKLALNVGYHNEHHDFPSIPWMNLPKVRAMAPEYYDNLVYHTSWFKLMFQFLFDKNLHLYSRIVRENRAGRIVDGFGEGSLAKENGQIAKTEAVTAN